MKPFLILIDDDSIALQVLERLFIKEFNVTTFLSTEEALIEISKNTDPLIIISDYQFPKMNGVEFFKRIKNLKTPSIRVLLSAYVSYDNFSNLVKDETIHRIFTKPWDNDYLKLQMLEASRQLKWLLDKNELETLSITDPLTGLTNQRYFRQNLKLEIARADRHKRALSLVMIDVDGFKKYNDSKGHPMGDDLLKKVADSLKKNLRNIDSISRYGGDEFIIIMGDTLLKDAHFVSERLRKEFEKEFSEANITLSLGISSFGEHGKTDEDLIKKADEALYQAKSQGRNRTIIAD